MKEQSVKRPPVSLFVLTSTEASDAVKVRPVMAGGDGLHECDGWLRESARGTEGVEPNMLLTILEGFLIVLSTKGDIIFLSDNVSKYLGMTQVHTHTRSDILLL